MGSCVSRGSDENYKFDFNFSISQIENIQRKSQNLRLNDFIFNKSLEQILNEYEMLNYIGKGASSVVRKVMNKSTKEIKAIKIIRKFKSKAMEKKLIQDISILRKINHPNIIKVYDFCYDEKNYYVLTEFVDGGEFFEKIGEFGTFNENLVSNIMKQILTGISYCHSQGLSHREIKLENILFEFQSNKKFTVKIIDFATSQAFSLKKAYKGRIGAPYYVSPEALKGKQGEKSDIWSCGVLLFLLLTGEVPFNGQNIDEIFKQIEIGKYKSYRLEHLSIESQTLIRKLLNIDPNKRISAEEALQDKWILGDFKKKTENLEKKSIVQKIQSFYGSEKISEAIINYSLSSITLVTKINELKSFFQENDLQNTKSLTSQKIVEGCQYIYGKTVIESDILQLLTYVENDKTNLNEFLYEKFLLIFKNACRDFFLVELQDTLRLFLFQDLGINCKELIELYKQYKNQKKFEQIIQELRLSVIHQEKISFFEFADIVEKAFIDDFN